MECNETAVSRGVNVDDVNFLNDVNDAVTCRQLAFAAHTQRYMDISNVDYSSEESLLVIADGQAATIRTGSAADIDYFLRQSTAIRDERPMSLISDSSSTDTGE